MQVVPNAQLYVGPVPYQTALDASVRDGQVLVGLPEALRLIHVMERPADYLLTFHTHRWYHINYICSGSVRVTTETQQYTVHAGEIFVMPPIAHQISSEDGYSQIGVDVLIANDSRGFSQMVQDTFQNQSAVLAVPPLGNSFTELYEMTRSMSKLDLLMLINIAESMVYRCLLEMQRPERNHSFRHQFIELSKSLDPFRTSLTEVSERLNISKTHLERLTKREFGCSVMEYFNRIKISHICLMLQTTEKSLSVLAEELNFYDESHLLVFFRRYMGTTPKKYRKEFLDKYIMIQNEKNGSSSDQK